MTMVSFYNPSKQHKTFDFLFSRAQHLVVISFGFISLQHDLSLNNNKNQTVKTKISTATNYPDIPI